MKFKTILKENGITYEVLSKAMGVTKQYISSILNERAGFYPLYPVTAQNMLKALNKIIEERKHDAYSLEDIFSKNDIR